MQTFLQLMSAAALIAFIVWRVAKARPHTRRAEGEAPISVLGSLFMLAIGLVIALVLPMGIPNTPGSPVAIVMYLLCWLVGGSIAIPGLNGLIDAWRDWRRT